MLIGAIALGLLAVLVMRYYIGTGSGDAVKTAASAPRPVHIVVAAEPLAAGKLDPTKLKLVDWPAGSVPVGAYTTLASIKPDAMLSSGLVAGEPLLPAKLTASLASISSKISPMMRAATIRVTDVTGTGGFILPGEHVDILVTNTPTQTAPASTDVLAQDIRVIAVNQDANTAKEKPEVVQSITVEVTPLQSQKLALAQIVGTVSLTLRNPGNLAPGQTPTVKAGDLKDRPAVAQAVSVVRQRPRPRRVVRVASHSQPSTTIEVVRGTQGATYQMARSE